MSLFFFGVVMMEGCGKENSDEPGSTSGGSIGGIAWPERRVSHMENPLRNLHYDFTWQNGKVKEILIVSTNENPDSLLWTFAYDKDKLLSTLYDFREYGRTPAVANFEFVYTGNQITDVQIHLPTSDEDDNEHVQHLSLTYKGNKPSEVKLKYWGHDVEYDDNGEVVRDVWEESVASTYTLGWTHDNITEYGIYIYGEGGDVHLTYDDHPNPLYMPLGPFEALGILEDSKFFIDGRGRFFSNALWSKNNITSFPLFSMRDYDDGEPFYATFRYDYDQAGDYPTAMYVVLPDGTERVFMTFSYEK